MEINNETRMNYNEKLKEKVELAKKCKYYIQKELECNEKYNQEIENEIIEHQNDYTSPINSSLYYFKENFFKTIGKNPFGNNLNDFKQEAISYLEESYPFCFGIDIRDDIYNSAPIEDFMYDLEFYAMALGATDEQISNIKDILKDDKFKTVERVAYSSSPDSEKSKMSIDSISGTTIKKYGQDDLYSVLMSLNDKNISGFIEYIMKSGGIKNSDKIFDGIAVFQDQNGDVLVSEGNHRIFTYKALKKVKEYITGEKIDGIEITPSIQRGISIPSNQIQDKSYNPSRYIGDDDER